MRRGRNLPPSGARGSQTSANQLDNSQEGWDAGRRDQLGGDRRRDARRDDGRCTSSSTWTSTRWASCGRAALANYENISQVLAAMEVIAPDGTVTLYNG